MRIFTSHKFPLGECPPNLGKNILAWKEYNPAYEFEYFNDEDMNEWMRNNVDSQTHNLFNKLNSGAGRADLFRVCCLYHKGGIWVDADLPAFDVDKEYDNFSELVTKNEVVIVRNRKCDNPRYTFIASVKNAILFLMLNDMINQHIKEAVEKKIHSSTIHVTGPFVLHKLLCKLCGLDNIVELSLNVMKKIMGGSFIYINDIVPEKYTYQEENVYSGYEDDLRSMKVTPHSSISAVKLN